MPINSQVYTRWAVSLATLEVKNDANFSLAFPLWSVPEGNQRVSEGKLLFMGPSQKCCRQETPCKPRGFNGWVQQPAMVAHILESQPDLMGRLVKTNTACSTSSPKGRKETRIWWILWRWPWLHGEPRARRTWQSTHGNVTRGIGGDQTVGKC